MFLDNLSVAVLRLCDQQSLSYEAAAERCELSPRHFGSIARRRTGLSVPTLEKLCRGLDVTPNQLLLPAPDKDLSYRCPMPVDQVRCFRCGCGVTEYPVCPRCHLTMEREYQRFCDRCGQKLDWSNLDQAEALIGE